MLLANVAATAGALLYKEGSVVPASLLPSTRGSLPRVSEFWCVWRRASVTLILSALLKLSKIQASLLVGNLPKARSDWKIDFYTCRASFLLLVGCGLEWLLSGVSCTVWLDPALEQDCRPFSAAHLSTPEEKRLGCVTRYAASCVSVDSFCARKASMWRRYSQLSIFLLL